MKMKTNKMKCKHNIVIDLYLCRYYWDLLMTFTYLYMFIAIPYILAFQRVAKSSGPETWNPVHPAYIICIFDIVLNFITGFKSRDGHEIFLDPFLIIR